jgi:light-regulated signal transduction histidine kinase (bacteriophytochrome)
MVASYMQLVSRRYKDKLDSDGQEFIGIAVDGAARMRAMILDLLAFSKIGRSGRALEAVECEKVLEGALANLQLVIQERGAQVTHDALPSVTGDAGQLAQLFQNLIGNALKFCSRETPQVHIGAVRDEDMWQFSVQDNGIGIRPDDISRIFVIFQRLHKKGEYPGTGIGLAVCKKIVEGQNGRIWVDSVVGEGTTFYFTLPAAA